MQVIHGREVPDGPIEAAKEFISLAVSGLATARNAAQDKAYKVSGGFPNRQDLEIRDNIQECIDELSTVQWHVLALKEIK